MVVCFFWFWEGFQELIYNIISKFLFNIFANVNLKEVVLFHIAKQFTERKGHLDAPVVEVLCWLAWFHLDIKDPRPTLPCYSLDVQV